jgi:alpha-glucuronidase
LPYSYKLHSGKTVIQTIYDSHYEGAARTQNFVQSWKSLKGLVDDQRYADVLAQLKYQSGHAIVWRDAINNWFYKLSGIADSRGRVGNHPGRFEAEEMELHGYNTIDVKPWESASGKAVVCATGNPCLAQMKFAGKPGLYELDVEYFDQNNGNSRFRILVGERPVDEWRADLHLPAKEPNGDSSTRHRTKELELHSGDVIGVEGTTDGEEHAPLDYVEIIPFSQEKEPI